MLLAWGVVVTALSLLAWGGQTLSWLRPATAARLGLMEREAAVDPAFYADAEGEARWDALTLWTMLAAGIGMIAGSSAWPYFGLVGGGIYLYFGGRGIAARWALARRGHRIGSDSDVRVARYALAVWLAMAAVTIIVSIRELRGR